MRPAPHLRLPLAVVVAGAGQRLGLRLRLCLAELSSHLLWMRRLQLPLQCNGRKMLLLECANCGYFAVSVRTRQTIRFQIIVSRQRTIFVLLHGRAIGTQAYHQRSAQIPLRRLCRQSGGSGQFTRLLNCCLGLAAAIAIGHVHVHGIFVLMLAAAALKEWILLLLLLLLGLLLMREYDERGGRRRGHRLRLACGYQRGAGMIPHN